MDLIVHPDTPARGKLAVAATAARDGARLMLRYRVTGDGVVLAIAEDPPGRADGLWRHTCFEAFVADAEGGYFEFNFAPLGAWAAYAFDAYRAGLRDADAAPEIAWDGAVLSAAVLVPTAGEWRVGLSAVIEEGDGIKSYWALAHASGPPDFHDRDCFTATLPAPR